MEICAAKTSEFSFNLGFPRVASSGASSLRTSRTLGTVSKTGTGVTKARWTGVTKATRCRTRTARTVPRAPFLLEALVKTRVSISMTGLVAMDPSNSLRALKMGMNSSLVESVEVSLPISSSALGKMATDRSLEDRPVVIRVKDIEQGRTDADQDA